MAKVSQMPERLLTYSLYNAGVVVDDYSGRRAHKKASSEHKSQVYVVIGIRSLVRDFILGSIN